MQKDRKRIQISSAQPNENNHEIWEEKTCTQKLNDNVNPQLRDTRDQAERDPVNWSWLEVEGTCLCQCDKNTPRPR